MKKLQIVLLSIVILFITSCQTKEKEAQSNILDFIANEAKFSSIELTPNKWSRLYFLYPKDLSVIPKYDKNDMDESVEHGIQMLNLLSSSLRLNLHGCSNETFDFIVKNDIKMKDLKTGAKEYAMIGFFKEKNKWKDVSNTAYCFTLDSTLNVINIYGIDDIKYINGKIN